MSTIFGSLEYHIAKHLNSVKQYLFHGKRIDTGEWVEGYYYPKLHLEGTPEEYWTHIIRSTEFGTEYEVYEHTVSFYIGRTDNDGNKLFLHDVILISNISDKAGLIFYDADRLALFIKLDSGSVYPYELILTYQKITRLGSVHDLNNEQLAMDDQIKKKFVELF